MKFPDSKNERSSDARGCGSSLHALDAVKAFMDVGEQKHKRKKKFSSKDAEKDFLESFKRLTCQHRAWDIWRDFVTMFACALSNAVDKTHYNEREALYLKTLRKYNGQERDVFPKLVADTVMALELNPEQDFLGKIYMSLGLGNEAGGQFFTPYSVCECMSSITLNDIESRVEEEGYVTIHDPCCGAGATLIASINDAKRRLYKVGLNFQNHILISAQDIDCTTALMCYIQLSLLGVAAYVKVGNALTEPMTTSDILDNYWFTLMYFSSVWSARRFVGKISSLFDGKGGEKGI